MYKWGHLTGTCVVQVTTPCVVQMVVQKVVHLVIPYQDIGTCVLVNTRCEK